MIAHIMVSGKVQGVGFRFFLQQKALSLGIHGWVKNLPNGTVEIEAEGTSDQLKTLVQSIKSGLNPFIEIDEVQVEMTEVTKGYKKFKVVY